MKSSMIFCLITTLSSVAYADESYLIKLDWTKKSTLSDNVTQNCGDTYYSNIKLEIPCKPYQNFIVETNTDITSDAPSLGGSVKAVSGPNSTVYTFEAINNGCSIQVDKVRKDLKEEPQHAKYEIN